MKDCFESIFPKEGEFGVLDGLPINQETLLKYAWASGDYNPIHYNTQVAQAMGLPGLIAHGMFSLALMSKAVVDFAQRIHGQVPFEIASIDTKFVAMVNVGDSISVAAKIQNQKDEDITLQLQMYKTGSREAVVCSGSLVLRMKSTGTDS